MRNQSTTGAFTLDNMSASVLFGRFPHRRQRADITTDILLDMSTEGIVSGEPMGLIVRGGMLDQMDNMETRLSSEPGAQD